MTRERYKCELKRNEFIFVSCNFLVNAIIDKYRDQRPQISALARCGVSRSSWLRLVSSRFGFQSIVEHISDMVANVHSLNTEDLDRLISVIRRHKEKLDLVRLTCSYSHSPVVFIFSDRIMNVFTTVYLKYS